MEKRGVLVREGPLVRKGVRLSEGMGAGGKMVTVSISETYDLSTKINKMSLIGIHTPDKTLIQKTYPGLAMNCKYFRIRGVSVRLVATSQLAISPDQVGETSDKIAPQDMLNPILYKACSNDSWSTLEARLNGLLHETEGSNLPIQGNSAFAENDDATGLADDFGVYYSLLSHRDGFKVAHPQQGLSMNNLVPLVFEKWYTHGENVDSGDDAPIIVQGADSMEIQQYVAVGMRGRPHRMPKINTTYLTGINPPGEGSVRGTHYQANGMSDGAPFNRQIQMPDVPPVMLGCIVLPPAKRTLMYYRMVVRCYIEFSDIRPIQDITSFDDLNTYAQQVYYSDYATLSKNMDSKTDMVDVKDADIEKVMEGQ